MNGKRVVIFAFVCMALVSVLGAQTTRQSGTVRGIVTDNEGNPIPGVTVTATSPALMGVVSGVTSGDGVYRLPTLPPGTYTITAELPGFQTVKQEGVIVRVGMVVAINITTEPSTISEEISVVASSPTVDVQSTKIGTVVTGELLQRLPLNRNLVNIFATVAGVSGTIDPYGQGGGTIHGSQQVQINYEVDGVNANDPANNTLLQVPQFDTMEEIEISTGGLPAQIGNTGGGFLNVVTKSGGNEFHGQVQTFYTRSELSQVLFPKEALKAMAIGTPNFPVYDLDASLILGGPIVKDKLWFFGNAAVKSMESPSSFIPTTIGGQQYDQYMDPKSTYEGFLKLTSQFSEKLRFFTMVNARILNQNVAWGGGSRTAYESTFTLENNSWIQATANLTWLLGSNTFVEFRVGGVHRDYPITEKPESFDSVCYQDRYTGYTYGAINTWASYITRNTAQGSVRATHFQDEFLGGDHELGLGVEYQWNRDRYFWGRKSPYNQWIYNGNPYYYRGYYGLSGPHPTFGDGRLIFTNYGTENNESGRYMLDSKISAYLQDAWTIKNRLTLNLGLRFDYFDGTIGEVVMPGVTGLRNDIGTFLEPELGYNHFGAYSMEPIKGLMTFFLVSPRLGVTYDLLGDGRTALKFSVSRYAENIPTDRFNQASGAQMASWQFDWWDYNSNGIPDSPLTSEDRYLPTGGLGSLWRPELEYLKDRIDPRNIAPKYTEAIAGIKHELYNNFAVGLQYIHKYGWDFFGSALYDRATSQYWYKSEDSPAGWWVPFTTIVPAYGDYPEQEVTVYYMSYDAPWNSQFRRQTNDPDAKRNYHAVELNFDKRYADGWALGGSVTWSNQKHFPGSLSSPNGYLNGYGRNDYPLIVKLFGSANLPFGFVSSFFYHHTSGGAYGRTVTVSPPSTWAKANNVYPTTYTVNVETSGARRDQSTDNLDVRVEKTFDFAFGKLGAFLDVYNLTGQSYINVGRNPGGTWYPTAENVREGKYTAASTYGRVTGLSGTRTLKFSLRFQF